MTWNGTRPAGKRQLGSWSGGELPVPPEGWSGAQAPPAGLSPEAAQAARRRSGKVAGAMTVLYAAAAAACALGLVSCAGELESCTSDPLPASKAATAIEWNGLTMGSMAPSDEQRAIARDIGIELGDTFTEDTYKLVTAATEAVEAMEERYGWSFKATNTRFYYSYDPLFSLVGYSTGTAITTCVPADGPLEGRKTTVEKEYGEEHGEARDDLWVPTAGAAAEAGLVEKVERALAKHRIDPDDAAGELDIPDSWMVAHSVPVREELSAEDAREIGIIVDMYIASDAGCETDLEYAELADAVGREIKAEGLRAWLHFIPECPDSARTGGRLNYKLADSWLMNNGNSSTAWEGMADCALENYETEHAEEEDAEQDQAERVTAARTANRRREGRRL